MKNDALIVKCSHCKKLFSLEKFESHECDIPLNDIVEIPVVYFRDDSYNNKKNMIGRGIDGTIYIFKVVPRKAIPVIEPIRRFFTATKSDKDFTEPL